MRRSRIPLLFKRFPFCRYKATRNKGQQCGEHVCVESRFLKKPPTKVGCFTVTKKANPVTHAIIDLDGVILDSAKYTITSHEDYMMKWKKNLKIHTKYNIMSMRNQDVGDIVTAEYEMPFNGKVYAHGVWQIQRVLYPKSQMVKGIDELLYYFIKHKIPLALMSSAHTKAFKILYNILQKTGLHKCFCHFVHGDMVKDGKPKTEMLCKAAKMFRGGCSEDYSKYLVIDSGVSGAYAAKAAGMQSVLLTDPCIPMEMRDIANVTLFNIIDFDPFDFNLPPIKKTARV